MYFKKICDCLNKSKMLTEVIAEKISLSAKAGGKNIRQYLYDDTNVSHVALIVYDLLPFPIKLGMRYENFHGLFLKNFSSIRSLILTKPEIVAEPEIAKKVKRKVTLKPKVSKIPETKKAAKKLGTPKKRVERDSQ